MNDVPRDLAALHPPAPGPIRYLTQVSNRLGMATLGVVATFTLPFAVIWGMWGMDFEHIPLHSNPHGFKILVFAQLPLGLLILAGLKWRKLL